MEEQSVFTKMSALSKSQQTHNLHGEYKVRYQILLMKTTDFRIN